MTSAEVKELFFQCDYPYYKGLSVKESHAVATLYSPKSDYNKEIVIDITDPGKAIHQLAIELIKLRSRELQIPEKRFA